ncbi:hypothetical protein [Streptomyces avicenniae]|uniref:hypothetical protein n=1 Tax=Streptomyces avicenniae TaxID=500153 RepID=UPI00069BCF1B|nr:hypothetical protein [Streptomyces avicenniae]
MKARTRLSYPHWLPPDGQVRIRPLGEGFDAVRVPSFQGLYAVNRLRLTGLSGPVIEDPAHGVLYWLVPPGAANDRGWPVGVVPLGRGYSLAVPGADRVGGPWVGDGEVRWLVVRPSGHCLTDPEVLYGALARVFGRRCA